MAKLSADRSYVNRSLEDTAGALIGTPANSVVCNPTAADTGASTLAIATSRIVGRGTSGNLTSLTAGNGLTFGTSSILLSGKSVTLYQSSEQTITAGGSLTLAHGLGGVPQFCYVYLVCKTIQYNYAVDQVYQGGLLAGNVANTGCAISPDATNLNIRYGSAAGTFVVQNYTTGATAAITNANWAAVFVAVRMV